MAALSDEIKTEIITRLACFESPTEIRADLETRGVEISDVSQITYYDPNTKAGDKLADRWKELFRQTREKFSNDLSDIPIAQKGYRLRGLQRMAKEAEKMKNYPLAAQLYEQAAKETGGAYLGKAAAGVADVDISDWSEIEFLERIGRGEDPLRVQADRARWLATNKGA